MVQKMCACHGQTLLSPAGTGQEEKALIFIRIGFLLASLVEDDVTRRSEPALK